MVRAEAFMAAAAAETWSSPCTPAQMMAAVAASPQPVVFTASTFSQGSFTISASSAATMPSGPKLTNTRLTPALSSASAAISAVLSPVMLLASNSFGLNA